MHAQFNTYTIRRMQCVVCMHVVSINNPFIAIGLEPDGQLINYYVQVNMDFVMPVCINLHLVTTKLMVILMNVGPLILRILSLEILNN